MKKDNCELEIKYLSQIIELKRAENKPRIIDLFWINKFKKKLSKRLKQLERDYDNGCVSDKAYKVWKKMITEVL